MFRGNSHSVAGGEESFQHPALLYRGDTEYRDVITAFVREGLDKGEPVTIAVPGPNLALLRDALGSRAGSVELLDLHAAGRNPGRILPAVLLAFADRHAGPVRFVVEQLWPGRTETEQPACVQHEALVNAAFAGRPLTVLCPFAAALGPVVLADVERTHPVLWTASGPLPSTRYDPAVVIAAPGALPAAVAAAEHEFDFSRIAEVRRRAAAWAAAEGLPGTRLDDFALVVSELTANSVLHGAGGGVLRLWAEPGHVVCEVADGGRLTDPLAGRVPPAPDAIGGRGLLLVNEVADLVRVHRGEDGTVVRAWFAL